MKILLALFALALCVGCRIETHGYRQFDGTETVSTQKTFCGVQYSSEYSRK